MEKSWLWVSLILLVLRNAVVWTRVRKWHVYRRQSTGPKWRNLLPNLCASSLKITSFHTHVEMFLVKCCEITLSVISEVALRRVLHTYEMCSVLLEKNHTDWSHHQFLVPIITWASSLLSNPLVFSWCLTLLSSQLVFQTSSLYQASNSLCLALTLSRLKLTGAIRKKSPLPNGLPAFPLASIAF